MMDLRYSMWASPNEHPQRVMRDLGITYEKAIPQPIADQWWFINCQNVPDALPKYLTELRGEKGEA